MGFIHWFKNRQMFQVYCSAGKIPLKVWPSLFFNASRLQYGPSWWPVTSTIRKLLTSESSLSFSYLSGKTSDIYEHLQPPLNPCFSADHKDGIHLLNLFWHLCILKEASLKTKLCMTTLRQAKLDPAGKTQSSFPEETELISLINQLVAVSPIPEEREQMGR